MKFKTLVLCSFALCCAFSVAAPADAQERIRIRTGGKTADTVVIDETSTPPKITISNGEARGAPGALVDLGNGEYEILVPGNAYYHLKTRSGADDVTVIDGPGNSEYWLGLGKDDDTLTIIDGPGNDEYKIEGKRGADVYDITDGDGADWYYVKTASGADQVTITDSPSDDYYKARGRPEATFRIIDPAGNDEVQTKGVTVLP